MTQDSTMAMSLPTERRRPLGDLTLTQVAASALAAVTSLAFSRHIGIAGSLIGAAVGSVSASVAGALYRSALDTSVEKIHEVAHRGEETVETRAAAQRKLDSIRSLARRVTRAAVTLAVALLVGFLAVNAFAYGVERLTDGQGIGPREPIIEYVTQQAAPADEAGAIADDTAEATPAEATPAEAPAAETADQAPAETTQSETNDGNSQQDATGTEMTDTMGQGAQDSAPQQESAANQSQATATENTPAPTSDTAA